MMSRRTGKQVARDGIPFEVHHDGEDDQIQYATGSAASKGSRHKVDTTDTNRVVVAEAEANTPRQGESPTEEEEEDQQNKLGKTDHAEAEMQDGTSTFVYMITGLRLLLRLLLLLMLLLMLLPLSLHGLSILGLAPVPLVAPTKSEGPANSNSSLGSVMVAVPLPIVDDWLALTDVATSFAGTLLESGVIEFHLYENVSRSFYDYCDELTAKIYETDPNRRSYSAILEDDGNYDDFEDLDFRKGTVAETAESVCDIIHSALSQANTDSHSARHRLAGPWPRAVSSRLETATYWVRFKAGLGVEDCDLELEKDHFHQQQEEDLPLPSTWSEIRKSNKTASWLVDNVIYGLIDLVEKDQRKPEHVEELESMQTNLDVFLFTADALLTFSPLSTGGGETGQVGTRTGAGFMASWKSWISEQPMFGGQWAELRRLERKIREEMHVIQGLVEVLNKQLAMYNADVHEPAVRLQQQLNSLKKGQGWQESFSTGGGGGKERDYVSRPGAVVFERQQREVEETPKAPEAGGGQSGGNHRAKWVPVAAHRGDARVDFRWWYAPEPKSLCRMLVKRSREYEALGDEFEEKYALNITRIWEHLDKFREGLENERKKRERKVD